MTARATPPAWLIRVASRPECGGGHVSRCRALARALAAAAPVVVVVDRGGERWLPELAAAGLTAVAEGQEPDGPWAGSVLDGYDFTSDDVERLAARASPLVVLDDFLEPPAAADLVVNPAPGLTGDAVAGIPALLGPRYALLDARFRSLPAARVAAGVETVVVCFGLGDPAGATELALAALERLTAEGFRPRIIAVTGSGVPHLARIAAAAARLGGRAELRTDVADMAALYRDADLVIGAGGVGLLERMACGVPSISVTLADNQRPAVAGAAGSGATVDAGAVGDLTPQGLAAVVERVARDRSGRAGMARQGQDLVDGRGADRVAAALGRLGRAGRDGAPFSAATVRAG